MSDIALNDFTYLQQYADFISKEEFWNDVILQLNKDLNKEFAINIPHSDLKGERAAELVVNALMKYLPSITPELSEVLYRIDVSEQQVNAFKELPTDIYYRCLGELIVKRIVLKVITRKMYSAKKIE
ncbi:MAG TPA: hypothetical protein VK783_04235 [Bacteroidia bacterium]|jgi:hypothetical protein|nr:hypothetical protein [Bacteroidia bacterium]